MRNNTSDIAAIAEFVDNIDTRLKSLNAKVVSDPSTTCASELTSSCERCAVNPASQWTCSDATDGERKQADRAVDEGNQQTATSRILHKPNAKVKVDRHIRKTMSIDIIGKKSKRNLGHQVCEIKDVSTEKDSYTVENKENIVHVNDVASCDVHSKLISKALDTSDAVQCDAKNADNIQNIILENCNAVTKLGKSSVVRSHTFSAGNLDRHFDYLDSTGFDNFVNTHSSPSFYSTENTMMKKNVERYSLLEAQKAFTCHNTEEKRKAVIYQLYKTENSYVDSLRDLVMKYYLPLKEKKIITDSQLNDIFYKIPEIHIHHQLLLNAFKKKLESWHHTETIGDILVSMFKKSTIADTYIGFVSNFPKALEVLRNCKELSAFSKFTEQQARAHEGKLTINDMIIQPIQRVPRYELFLKDLLQYTSRNHPDLMLIQMALAEVHKLAINIDKAKNKMTDEDIADELGITDGIKITQDV